MAEITTPWGEKTVTQEAKITTHEGLEKWREQIRPHAEEYEAKMDREEALWLFICYVMKFTTNADLEELLRVDKYGLDEKQVEILKSHYNGDMEKLRKDCDNVLTGMGECYFDA